jgi:hypothetical protein
MKCLRLAAWSGLTTPVADMTGKVVEPRAKVNSRTSYFPR